MFYWHVRAVTGPSHGNDSSCVLTSHHRAMSQHQAVMGVFFKRFFHKIFLQSALSQNNTLWIRSCVILIPAPVAWACPTFFPVVTLLSWWLWWLGNGCWYKYSQLQRFIHSLQSLLTASLRSSGLNGSSMGSHSMRETQEKLFRWVMSFLDIVSHRKPISFEHIRHKSESLDVVTMSSSQFIEMPPPLLR